MKHEIEDYTWTDLEGAICSPHRSEDFKVKAEAEINRRLNIEYQQFKEAGLLQTL